MVVYDSVVRAVHESVVMAIFPAWWRPVFNFFTHFRCFISTLATIVLRAGTLYSGSTNSISALNPSPSTKLSGSISLVIIDVMSCVMCSLFVGSQQCLALAKAVMQGCWSPHCYSRIFSLSFSFMWFCMELVDLWYANFMSHANFMSQSLHCTFLSPIC